MSRVLEYVRDLIWGKDKVDDVMVCNNPNPGEVRALDEVISSKFLTDRLNELEFSDVITVDPVELFKLMGVDNCTIAYTFRNGTRGRVISPGTVVDFPLVARDHVDVVSASYCVDNDQAQLNDRVVEVIRKWVNAIKSPYSHVHPMIIMDLLDKGLVEHKNEGDPDESITYIDSNEDTRFIQLYAHDLVVSPDAVDLGGQE